MLFHPLIHHFYLAIPAGGLRNSLRFAGLIAGFLAALALVPGTASAALTPADYGALPRISMMSISPGGDMIAYRMTDGDRDIGVVYSLAEGKHVASVDLSEIRPQSLYFATDEDLIFVVSETRQILGFRGSLDLSTAFAFNLEANKVRQLLVPKDTIYGGQEALGRIVGISPDKKYVYMPAYVPDSKIDEDPRMSLLRVNLDSPRSPKVHFKGTDHSIDYFVDEQGEVIVHEIFNNQRNLHRILARHGDEWKEIYRVETELMQIAVVGLMPDRNALVVKKVNDETGRKDFYTMSLQDGSMVKAGWGREDADTEDTYQGLDRVVRGVRYSGFTPSYRFFDPKLQQRLEKVQSIYPEHSVWLRDWSDDWNDLIVYVEGSQVAGTFLKLTGDDAPQRLATARPSVSANDVHPIATTRFKARDGLVIPTLLTIPRDRLGDLNKLPAVMMPHGGPAAYDRIGFDWMAQALANQGYLVIQPQFRGSSGFGFAHQDAGTGEWGRKMQDDLTDALDMLVRKDLVDPDRVCIVGSSYGGYAALAGAAFTPELYRCVVSINGVADLHDMLNDDRRQFGSDHWVVAYWQNLVADGDVDKERLREVSPIEHVASFEAPVLLVHGEHDGTVPISQSKDMYKKLRRAKREVEFIELEGESHYLQGAETRMQTVEAVISFIDKQLAE